MVRIGAVNCQEDWGLCQRQGIRSYPSVILYPSVSGVFLSLSVFHLSWFSLYPSAGLCQLCLCLSALPICQLCLSSLLVSVSVFACVCQLCLCLSSLLVAVSFICVCLLCLCLCLSLPVSVSFACLYVHFFCLSDLPAVSTCLPFCLSVMASTYIHVWLLWLASKQIHMYGFCG